MYTEKFADNIMVKVTKSQVFTRRAKALSMWGGRGVGVFCSTEGAIPVNVLDGAPVSVLPCA